MKQQKFERKTANNSSLRLDYPNASLSFAFGSSKREAEPCVWISPNASQRGPPLQCNDEGSGGFSENPPRKSYLQINCKQT